MDTTRLPGLLEEIRLARKSESTIGLSAYENNGPPLSAHVRDAVYATTKKGRASALSTLEELAREFMEPEHKLRPDMNEIAHRVMRQATGQEPKTPPPDERSEDQKNPEAVARGAKGGESKGD